MLKQLTILYRKTHSKNSRLSNFQFGGLSKFQILDVDREECFSLSPLLLEYHFFTHPSRSQLMCPSFADSLFGKKQARSGAYGRLRAHLKLVNNFSKFW